MSERAPLLSVVIATNNRVEYAVHAVQGILAIDDPALELVVHDSSDAAGLDKLREASGDDRRLVYRHWPERISMTENYNRAIDLATGRYICVIGDDDGVSPDIMQLVRWAQSREIDAVSPDIVSNYAWPDFTSSRLGARHAARLYVGRYTGKCRWVDSVEVLERSLRFATQGVDQLPKLYHGVVARAVLLRIKAETGDYLHGVSPDVSGALSIALRVPRFVRIDYPFTVPGAAGRSNTGRSAMGRHQGPLQTDPHIRPYRNLRWPKQIPAFFSVETVWAQAGYETLSRNAQNPDQMNMAFLYALCYLSHPGYAREIGRALGRHIERGGVGRLSLVARVLGYASGHLARRAWYVVRRLSCPTASGGRYFVGGLPDIAVAMRKLDVVVQGRGIDWHSCEHLG